MRRPDPLAHTRERTSLAFEACHRARGARRLAAGLVVRAAVVRIVAVVLVLAARAPERWGLNSVEVLNSNNKTTVGSANNTSLTLEIFPQR